jgi:cytochrome c-type biogenesis protein CcmF
MFIGIAVSATYQLEQEVQLRPGESFTLGEIEFQYKQLDVQRNERKNVVFAEVSVHKNGKNITTVSPQKRFYGEPPDWQITTEIGLYTSLTFDIYVILQGWQEDQTAVFTFIINPLILWIWIGAFLMFTVGILLEILPTGRVKTDTVRVKDASQVKTHD